MREAITCMDNYLLCQGGNLRKKRLLKRGIDGPVDGRGLIPVIIVIQALIVITPGGSSLNGSVHIGDTGGVLIDNNGLGMGFILRQGTDSGNIGLNASRRAPIAMDGDEVLLLHDRTCWHTANKTDGDLEMPIGTLLGLGNEGRFTGRLQAGPEARLIDLIGNL